MKCVVSLLILAVCLCACSSKSEELHKDFSSELKVAIEKTAIEERVSIDEVANFSWDRLYIFTPYTSDEEIYRTLGFTWKQASKTKLNSRDDINLLVFVKDGNVIYYIEFPREYGDFSDIQNPDGFTPSNAVFKVTSKSSNTEIKKLIWISD